MLLRVYSVYDQATETYGVPFFSMNHKVAERSFAQLVNDPQSTVHYNSQDFSLYHIGHFEDPTALLVPQVPPALIGRASSYLQRTHLEATSLQVEESSGKKFDARAGVPA